jgi:hypothetical protein
MSYGSSVGKLNRSGLTDGIRIPTGRINITLHQRICSGYGVHVAFYPMDTEGCFSGDETAEARS